MKPFLSTSRAQSIKISSNTASLMVEIKVFCANSTAKLQLTGKIKSRIKSISMFHHDYLEAVDTGNCSTPPVVIIVLDAFIDHLRIPGSLYKTIISTLQSEKPY